MINILADKSIIEFEGNEYPLDFIEQVDDNGFHIQVDYVRYFYLKDITIDSELATIEQIKTFIHGTD